ncbi:hypothetical protein ACO34A_18955 [Rhizobium sp. ACO-34A]|nr:hypothetical protein ACO34A_18955 [Rhizobium sp. ACO-34A]
MLMLKQGYRPGEGKTRREQVARLAKAEMIFRNWQHTGQRFPAGAVAPTTSGDFAMRITAGVSTCRIQYSAI